MPVYLVTVQGNPAKTHLVDASTKAAAINHVIKSTVSADPLTASELVAHMKGGAQVETASSAVEKQEPKTVAAPPQEGVE